MKSYVFHKNKHLFFDDLVLLLATDISIAVAIDAYKYPGKGEIFGQNEYFDYEGSPNVSKLSLRFFPYNMMLSLCRNTWPVEIELFKVEQSENESSDSYKVSSTYELHAGSVQACFSKYFEKSRILIEKQFGSDSSTWPSVMNFGRVIRNTFSHGGRIHFQNKNATAVSWRGLTYDPSMNGKQILYNDMNAVEIIILMNDINSAINRC